MPHSTKLRNEIPVPEGLYPCIK